MALHSSASQLLAVEDLKQTACCQWWSGLKINAWNDEQVSAA